MEITTSSVQTVIAYFNLKASSRFRHNAEKNVEAVTAALEAVDGDIATLKRFMREQIEAGNSDLIDVCDKFVCEHKKPVSVAAPAQAAPVAAATGNDNLSLSMEFLSKVVVDMLAKMKLDEVQANVAQALKDDVKQFILDNYGPITRKVAYETPERKVELKGVVHEKFDEILAYVQANIPVYLTGPAGSGKNVICKQIADVMGVRFYFSNAVTQEYKLTGFTDAMGNFHESQFYKAFVNGGVFMLDELDASNPEVVNILNAAIANRYFDFPAPIGYVEAHPNFRVVAAGNTLGYGADHTYIGRNQLDGATLNRFVFIRIDYDARIEEFCANGDAELLGFCRKFRKAANKAGIQTIVSYRQIEQMAKMSAAVPTDALMESCLIKALDVDDLKAIEGDVAGCGKYSAAFKKVLNRREAA